MIIRFLTTALCGVLAAGLYPLRSDAALRFADAAPATDRDSIAAPIPRHAEDEHPRYRLTELIAPAALTAIGVWGACGSGFTDRINRETDDALGGHSHFAPDDAMQFVPMAAMLLPDRWVGSHARYDWRSRALMTLTAEVLTEAVVQPLKHTVSSPRPDGSDNHGFPSGHTARAFAGAELMRQAYGPWAGAGGYLFAAGVGYLRIRASRHRLTDIAGGAGIGILAAQAARLLLPLELRLFGLDRPESPSAPAAALLPAWSADACGPALAFALVF